MSSAADADFDVRATVSDSVFEAAMRRYRGESDRATGVLRGHRGIVYDERSGERLDVWGIGESPRPVFVFLHGGYWRALCRADSAFMAGMLAERGIATVAVDYTLAPAATLAEIVRQVRASVAWVYHRGADHGLDPNRIVIGGSSAGGHLTATTMLDGWQSEWGLPNDVVTAAMPISGLFDLRPLVGGFTDGWLGLDDTCAEDLSPALHLPRRRPAAVIAVAVHDGRGFLRQSEEFDQLWNDGSPGSSRLLVVPERNHYDVVLDLVDAETALSKALLRLLIG